MEKIRILKIAYIPLGIFIINFFIYLLIDVFGEIYTYSGTAKKIYLFFCFPTNLIGLIISAYLFIKVLIFKKSFWNIILCIPLIIFVLYFYFFPLIQNTK